MSIARVAKFITNQLLEKGNLPEDVNSFKAVHISLSKKTYAWYISSFSFTKLEKGDFKIVIHLASPGDTIVEYSEDTMSALRDKHLAPHADTHIPPHLI